MYESIKIDKLCTKEYTIHEKIKKRFIKPRTKERRKVTIVCQALYVSKTVQYSNFSFVGIVNKKYCVITIF